MVSTIKIVHNWGVTYYVHEYFAHKANRVILQEFIRRRNISLNAAICIPHLKGSYEISYTSKKHYSIQEWTRNSEHFRCVCVTMMSILYQKYQRGFFSPLNTRIEFQNLFGIDFKWRFRMFRRKLLTKSYEFFHKLNGKELISDYMLTSEK